MSQNRKTNSRGKQIAVVIGATSKWQSNGRNTLLAHGRMLDDSDLPVGARWGVGGAIAQKFAQEGFFVVLTTRKEGNALALAKAIGEQDGECMMSGRQRLVDRAKRENLTVRQLAQIAGSYGGLAMVGTPPMIADQMEEWLVSEGCDGFNVMFPYVPGGLDDFVDRVVPELQRRGIFRREYEGKTLRENLGLPRPANRFFSNGRPNH